MFTFETSVHFIFKPFTKQQHFRLVQIQSICKKTQNNCNLDIEFFLGRVENIVGNVNKMCL